jgi:[acyl-carrier-protein] S-malonyltransferase
MAVLAFIFPGQGSQSVGMGRDLAAAFASAREVFQEVDDILGQKLSKLMFDGPGDELILTENTQPALMALSLAVVRVLEREAGIRIAERATVVAGHSLGEYSALAAAGSLRLTECATLLRKRGQAMQEAVPPGQGAMAALMGVEMPLAIEICLEAEIVKMPGEPDRHEIVQAANDNGGGQVVISGAKAAVERAIEIAKTRGVKRAMLLPVSAPFHCALMEPAARVMAEALARATIAPPAVPLIANVTAAKVTDPNDIRHLLVKQVTGTVRWRESMAYAAALGVDSFVELGAGKVLSGLVKRILPDATALNAGTPAEIEALIKLLG